jgi:hypothetical protein
VQETGGGGGVVVAAAPGDRARCLLESSCAMALVDCPDCGRKVSDKAEACPSCARPIARDASVARSAEAAPPASTIPEQRRSLPTHVVVCTRCGEEEIFAYRASQSSGYVCVACEERALYAQARRRGVLQWWPLALIVILLCGFAAVMSGAIDLSRGPQGPGMRSG